MLACFVMQSYLARHWIETREWNWIRDPDLKPPHLYPLTLRTRTARLHVKLSTLPKHKVWFSFHRVARGWWGVARNWRFAWPSQWRLCSGKRTQSNRFPLLSPKMTTFCACPVSKVNHRHIVDALGSVDTPQPTHPHPPRYYLIIAGCQ